MTRPLSDGQAPADPRPDSSEPVVNLSGQPYVAGDVPSPLRDLLALPGAAPLFGAASDEECNRHMCQLLFAARDLAEAQIEPASDGDSGFCGECLQTDSDGLIAHESNCKTARVMRLIAELCALTETRISQRKEAATEGTGAAGDGIRPRDLLTVREVENLETRILGTPYDWAAQLTCMACGQSGGEGWSLVSQQSHCVRALCFNECELRRSGWSYVYQHYCGHAENGGAA